MRKACLEIEFKKRLRALLGDREGLVLVACSGGVDSMAMLELARRVLPAGSIAAANVDHGQRDDSPADAALVSRYCARHGLAFESRRLELPRKSSEAALRKARYAALFEIARARECETLLTAHHAQDRLETYLLRLLRGAHPDTIRGIPARNAREGVAIVRPLLGFAKADLAAFAREHGVPWREDETNRSPGFARNRIRNELVPLLDAIRAGASRNALAFFEELERARGDGRRGGETETARIDELTRRLRSSEGLAAGAPGFHALKTALDALLGEDASRTTKAHWENLKRQLALRGSTRSGGGPKKVLQFPGGKTLTFEGNRLFWDRAR